MFVLNLAKIISLVYSFSKYLLNILCILEPVLVTYQILLKLVFISPYFSLCQKMHQIYLVMIYLTRYT